MLPLVSLIMEIQLELILIDERIACTTDIVQQVIITMNDF